MVEPIPTDDVLDAAMFRRALGLFATGVTVITVQQGDVVHGMTANAFSSVSLEPPLVLFCVTRTARMAVHIQQAAGFAINFLADDQQQASRHFAGAQKTATHADVVLRAGRVAPLLDGALATLTCLRHAIVDGGDHCIVIGRVIDVALRPDVETTRPLAFFRSRYADVRERTLPTLPGAGTTDVEVWQNDAIQIYHDEWSHGAQVSDEDADRLRQRWPDGGL